MRLVGVLLLLAVTVTPTTLHAQWDMEESHTTAGLRGIVNVGGGVAWASGTNGTVLRTEDGGYLWQGCATPPGAEKLDFRGIQAWDENTAIVMSSGKGDLSRLYKTTDGCRTWHLLFTNPDKEGFWDAIKFIDAKRFPKDKDFGMLLGDPVDGRFAIFLSFDLGKHWERQIKQAPAAQPKEGVFAASNSSLIIDRIAERAFVTGGPTGARLINFSVYGDDTVRESDWDAKVLPGAKEFYFYGKRRWRTSNLPLANSASAGAFSIAARPFGGPEQIGYQTVVVGGDYQHPNDSNGTAAYISYGTLSAATTQPQGYRSAVAYEPTTKSWITVGPNGTDISTDDGKNWRPLKPTQGEPVDADKNWNALSLPFVVGPNGRIGKLRSTALPTAGSSKAKREQE
jgi:hypothetical protein